MKAVGGAWIGLSLMLICTAVWLCMAALLLLSAEEVTVGLFVRLFVCVLVVFLNVELVVDLLGRRGRRSS